MDCRTSRVAAWSALLIITAWWAPLHGDELDHGASWKAPTAGEWRRQVVEWLNQQKKLDPVKRERIVTLWPEEEGPVAPPVLLQRVCDTAAVFDPRAAELVRLCQGPPPSHVLRPQPVTHDEKLAPWLRDNLRLLYGSWLARNHYYDEALAELADLRPEQVADPATLLFYQAAGYHRMLDKEKCLAAVSRLLERESELPRRYRMLAQLIAADLKPLKKDSLDEIARLMDEIERRLSLYQAGKKTRDQEDEVIAKLDKLIKKLEEQQQQQQQNAGGGSSRSSNPAQDSGAFGGHGPGRVDKKFIGNKSGWGNLPPKEREAALQQITKDLPAHYREVIEGYFRKLANSGK